MLTDAVWTYFKLNRKEAEEERKLLTSSEFAEVNEMFQTKMQKLKADAAREGRQEGRQEGQVEGRTESLLRVLRSRFSDLPDDWTDAIRRMSDPARIGALIERAATVSSLEDIRVEIERIEADH